MVCDELRMSYTIRSQIISWHLMKAKPDSNFSMVGSVTGPPLFVDGQVAEGYANDDNISYFVKDFPSADSFSAVGFNWTFTRFIYREISGIPLQGGEYNV